MAATGAGKQPNILLIMFDQMSAQSLPCYRHAVVKAPHLQGLAARGVVFENAYCNSPLCSPSRSAMMTGQLPSRIGAYDNAAELNASVPTFAHHLRALGYRTCLSGKMDFTGADQLHGYEERLTTDLSPSDFGWTPEWERPEKLQPWFHDLASVVDAGPYDHSLAMAYDEEATDQAVRWLYETAGGADERPFLLTLSFMHPHDPYLARREFWDLYEGADLGRPAAGRAADPLSERLRAMCGLDDRPLSAEEEERARRAYLAAVSYADERIGEVLDALLDCGLAGDTVVVFTADHGELLGEHGLWYKMSFFDPSARVPLIVRVPGREPGRVAGSVSHLDLAPTLAEWAGADLGPDELDGTSLVPLMGGVERPGDVVAEYLAEGVTDPAVMIRRGRHKYVRCGDDPDQLFDLAADPHEQADLAGDASSSELAASLREEADARWDLAGLRRRVIASQRRRHEVSRALAVGAHTPWDFQPWMDETRRFVRAGAAGRPRAGERPLGGELPGEPPADHPR